MRAASVAVVVPAHQEEASIAPCLRAVRRALHHARRRGVVSESLVVVVAHRCDDSTAALAGEALGGDGVVLTDVESDTVGEVRARGARLALDRLTSAPRYTWVLSTDADTVVPAAWVTRVLEESARHRSRAVVGLARLDRWHGSVRGWAAYRALVRSGLGTRRGLDQHRHVYGANLAVRADAYLDVGGFEACTVAEDHLLVARLVAAGHPVLRTRAVVVRTSGRRVGRAAGGLADRIASLDPPRDGAAVRAGQPVSQPVSQPVGQPVGQPVVGPQHP